MTLQELKDICIKNNIPDNVRLLSDSGWEVYETEMDGVYYSKKENVIIFTQDNESDYIGGRAYINEYYSDLVLLNKKIE